MSEKQFDKRGAALRLAQAINGSLEPTFSQDDIELLSEALRAFALSHARQSEDEAVIRADAALAVEEFLRDTHAPQWTSRLQNLLGHILDRAFAPSTTRQIDEHTALQLAAISVASIQNTRDSAKQRIGRDSPYWTQTYEDVCAAVDREMDQRERATRLYEIEHAAWHFLESGEERVSDKELAFDLPNEDYDKLVALLSDAHPEPGASVPSATPRSADSNYVCDHDTFPQKVTFANGRVVKMVGQGHLAIGWKE